MCGKKLSGAALQTSTRKLILIGTIPGASTHGEEWLLGERLLPKVLYTKIMCKGLK